MSSTSASGLTALSSTLLGLSFVAVSLRFYTRHKQQSQLKSDDWIMIPCLFLYLGTTATTFYGLQHKLLGYPTPSDPVVVAETAPTLSKLYIAFDLFSAASLACTKISAVLFYRRIFCDRSRKTLFNYLTISTILIIVFWVVSYLILTGFVCGTHFSALWTNRSDFNKYCAASHPYLLSLSISDFILDTWILALPMPLIWSIQITLRRKIAVTGVFLLAFAGLGACIARMVIFIQLDNGTIPIIDPRVVNSESIYLGVLEAGLSLIAVNLPSLWFLFSKVTVEKILYSVRSMISLRSSQSAVSLREQGYRSSNQGPSHFDKGSTYSSSQSHITQPDALHFQTLAMHDQDMRNNGLALPPGKIQVTESMSHSTTQG